MWTRPPRCWNGLVPRCRRGGLRQPRRLGKGGLPQVTTRVRHGLAPVLEVHSIGFLRWGPSGPARPVLAQPRRIDLLGRRSAFRLRALAPWAHQRALLWHSSLCDDAECEVFSYEGPPVRACPGRCLRCQASAAICMLRHPEGGINEIPFALAHPCAPGTALACWRCGCRHSCP